MVSLLPILQKVNEARNYCLTATLKGDGYREITAKGQVRSLNENWKEIIANGEETVKIDVELAKKNNPIGFDPQQNNGADDLPEIARPKRSMDEESGKENEQFYRYFKVGKRR